MVAEIKYPVEKEEESSAIPEKDIQEPKEQSEEAKKDAWRAAYWSRPRTKKAMKTKWPACLTDLIDYWESDPNILN